MSFVFKNKAETLAALAGRLTAARILPLRHFTVAEWRGDPGSILAALAAEPWGQEALIVRSSAQGEDAAQSSQAGHYLSKAAIAMGDVSGAIEEVIESYGREEGEDRLLVQPLLSGVTASGVAFTRDPSTGAPYLVVNASEGEDTALITSGKEGGQWCHYHWLDGPAPVDRRLLALLSLAKELIALTGNDALDFEFAFDGAGGLWLLQLRPLAMKVPPVDAESHRRRMEAIVRKVAEAMRPHPFLHGSRTVFGIMPDWNPAEMIGVRPTPLSLSLYRDLVTDGVWAYQRHNYGYKNLRSFPLMVHFHGLPYIDVRVSFNSFVPREIDGPLAEKLVDHYVESLLVRPALHDKVEFEIVFSAYTFDLGERLARLAARGFTADDRTRLAEALRRLTNRIIDPETGLWKSDSARLPVLEQRREATLASKMSAAEKIYWLIEDCKRYGTLPFAGLARAGFIAVQMLKSLVAVGALSQADMNGFMGGLSTIGGELARDAAILGRDAFLDKYGHLRPGTYDIRAPRYDEAPELYGIAGGSGEAPDRPPFRPSDAQRGAIAALLKEHGLAVDVDGLFVFFKAAIEGRERAKFAFTRNLSDALSLLADFGERHGFSRDEMAFADIGIVRELQASSDEPGQLLANSIAAGKARHAAARCLALPAVISAPGDVWSFRMLETEPNFITLGNVTAPVRRLEAEGGAEGGAEGDLKGAIVCIPSADPGYDWIFGKGIAGLITAYGGANSHMAIRAAEMNLPAVIGTGETLFRRWSGAEILRIDCANRKVEILR